MNPFTLTGPEKFVLEAGIEQTWADEVWRERGQSLSAKDLRTVVLLATGSEEQADEAVTAKIEDDLRNDRKPEL